MSGNRWIMLVMIVAVSVGIGVAVVAPGAATPTVKGDAAAWAEIAAAYRKLNGLPGYRMKGVITGGGAGGGTMVFEVAPPNRAYHATMQMTRGTVEIFSVGDKILQRLPNGQCQAMGQDPARIPFLRGPNDPRDNFVYTVSRKPDTLIDGTPVHSYGLLIENPRGGQPIPVTLYIGTQSGLPRRTVSTFTVTMAGQGTTRETSTTMDYYDYDTKLDIALPNC